MTEVTELSYNEIAKGLDLPYVRAAGEEIRVRMFPRPTQVRNARGEMVDGPTPYPLPVALSYQPGDSTSYNLVFTQLRSIRQVGQLIDPDRANLVPAGRYDSEGIPLEGGYVLVTKVNESRSDFSFVVDLAMERPYLHVSYVAEKIRENLATATAITVLLRAIAGQEILDPEED